VYCHSVCVLTVLTYVIFRAKLFVSLITNTSAILITLPVVLFVDASGDGADICGVLISTGEPAVGDDDEPSAPDPSDLMWTGDSARKK
jgi:hypothetical protein